MIFHICPESELDSQPLKNIEGNTAVRIAGVCHGLRFVPGNFLNQLKVEFIFSFLFFTGHLRQ